MTTPIASRTAGHRWAVLTAVAGTVFIAAGAFWLSFTALADLARRSGIDEAQAWAWPLIVDGIIVVATVAVVALSGQRTAWYPWALLIGGASVSVTANAIHAIVAADADVPSLLAASVAAVPPVVLLAITHLTVILTRRVPTLDTTGAVTRKETTPAARPARLSEAAVRPVARRLPPTPASDSAPVDPPRRTKATHPDTGTTTQARRAQALELRGHGWSNKRIARELGVHPSTVGRWFSAAHLPSDETVEEARTP